MKKNDKKVNEKNEKYFIFIYSSSLINPTFMMKLLIHP